MKNVTEYAFRGTKKADGKSALMHLGFYLNKN